VAAKLCRQSQPTQPHSGTAKRGRMSRRETLTVLKDTKIITFPKPNAVVGSMLPKKSSLDSLFTLSNQALCKLRDEIAEELKSRAESLKTEINQLVGPASSANNEHRRGPRKRHKVAPKYTGPHGEKWSGRGLKPRWLTNAISKGKRLDDFLIGKPKKNTSLKHATSTFADASYNSATR
jgi:DNA-binding protein H-NS